MLRKYVYILTSKIRYGLFKIRMYIFVKAQAVSLGWGRVDIPDIVGFCTSYRLWGLFLFWTDRILSLLEKIQVDFLHSSDWNVFWRGSKRIQVLHHYCIVPNYKILNYLFLNMSVSRRRGILWSVHAVSLWFLEYIVYLYVWQISQKVIKFLNRVSFW